MISSENYIGKITFIKCTGLNNFIKIVAYVCSLIDYCSMTFNFSIPDIRASLSNETKGIIEGMEKLLVVTLSVFIFSRPLS